MLSCLAAPFCGPLSAQDEPAPRLVEPPFSEVDDLSSLRTGDPLVDWNSVRTLTSTDGKTVKAKILAADDDSIEAMLANGQTTSISLSRLSEEDRRFVAEWRAVSRYFNLGYEPLRSLSNSVEAEIRDGAFAKTGTTHSTRHFLFESDEPLTADTVRDFSRMFEATYYAVEANPLALAIDDPPGGKFKVRLFANDGDYHAAGGSETAAGVYLLRERVMLVPFSSLGLEKGLKGYKQARKYDPRTLIHETVHALTHQWLDFAPLWFCEGFADYIAAIPYEDGAMYFDGLNAGLRVQAERKLGATDLPLEKPLALVRIGDREFMGEPEPEEKPVVITPVEAYQIQLVSKEGENPDAADDTTTSADASPANEESSGNGTGSGAEPETMTKPQIPALFPPGGAPRPVDGGRSVVMRYVSSMMLVDYFLANGETERLRKFLFRHLHYEWDRNRYLERYEAAYDRYRAEVNQQIADFDGKLDEYNRKGRAYFEAVERYNAGEIDKLPPEPGELEVPDAVPVPEILATPRSPEDLSRKTFRSRAVDEHLELPDRLDLPPP